MCSSPHPCGLGLNSPGRRSSVGTTVSLPAFSVPHVRVDRRERGRIRLLGSAQPGRHDGQAGDSFRVDRRGGRYRRRCAHVRRFHDCGGIEHASQAAVAKAPPIPDTSGCGTPDSGPYMEHGARRMAHGKRYESFRNSESAEPAPHSRQG